MPEAPKKYVAINEDLLSTPLDPPEDVRLMGTRCLNCGEVFFGKAVACQQCQSERVEPIKLSRTGKLFSYTVNRGKPPGDYKGPEPFQPFGVGLVELPEGISILAPLSDCDVDNLKIGAGMELDIRELYKDQEGNSVLAFAFRPASPKKRRQ